MTTDELLSLEEMMSKTYYTFIVEIINFEITGDKYSFSLSDYAEIIRELTKRENK